MSTIYRDSTGRGIDEMSVTFEKAKCHVCLERPADAFWFAPGGDIKVCYWCALEALPALIADAMRARPKTPHLLFETHQKMDATFWRAAALAFAHEPTPSEVSDFEARQILDRVDFDLSRDGGPPP